MLGWLLTLGALAASITTLITGLTLITVARVMVLGVRMREELDVTV
jgi:hypothetical protein